MKMEFFDICDENGIPTGEIVERGIAHRDGIPHRTAHIWLFREMDGNCQILLQQRSFQKDSFPGMWDTSSAGHIQAGDEPLESALRELEEELGIKAEPSQLKFAGTFHISYQMEFHGSLFKDDEVAFVFVYDTPVGIESITIQKEELEGVRWFDFDEVYNECRQNIRERFCVPTEGLEVLKKYLERQSKVKDIKL